MLQIKNPEDTAAYKISTRLLMQIALSKGYDVYYYPSSPSTQSGITHCVKGSRELFFKGTCSALTPAFGVFAAENKALTYSLLMSQGIPMPDSLCLDHELPAEQAVHMLAKHSRLIVKPVATNHGDGITIGIETAEELQKAISYARRIGGIESDIIVQEQVEGSEYRFLVVSGKVIAVASRRPPFVTGDGVHSVEDLIAVKNEDPLRGKGHTSPLTIIDTEEVRLLKGPDFLRQVPDVGREVQVLDTSNLSRGGEAADYTDIASRTLKKMAVEAAKKCFLGIAGVDIITKDITAETADDSYVIEVNLTPGIRMHQFPSYGTSRDVASVMFAEIEKTSRPIGKPVTHVGRVEKVVLPELSIRNMHARVDTGATVSSIWASDIQETDAGLSFCICDKGSEYYTGKRVVVKEYNKRAVSSSMGQIEIRYQVSLLVVIGGRRVRASVTLADRSTQVYPMLVGRNILRNKFIVDVSIGKARQQLERAKRTLLNNLTKKEGSK